MPKVTFITFQGARHEVPAEAGSSLMLAAVRNQVPGIDADCGGHCACATCHVFVDAPWAERLAPPSPMEAEMLSFTAEQRTTSRLACQITMTEQLDGIEVSLPEAQH